MTYTFGTFCSGIGAPEAAWMPLGWKPVFFSEIEPFPCAVLAHHYPSVPNLGDMTRINTAALPEADIWMAGTPCQAFSVAGLRKSLDDDRGNLTLRFCEMVNERNPAVIVWENVPGVLSTKDNAFGCFLAGLVGEGEPLVCRDNSWPNAGMVVGPRRSAAWRVLDAQYFRLAQRRRRVFVVSFRTGDGHNPGAVLFEPDSVRRDSPPSRETGARVAASLTRGADSGGKGGYAGRRREDDTNLAVVSSGHGWWDESEVGATVRSQDSITKADTLIVGSLNANGKAAGSATQQDAECGMLVTHSLRAEGFDASEDGTGRGTPLVPVAMEPTYFSARLTRNSQTSNQVGIKDDGLSDALSTDGPGAIAFAQNQRDEIRDLNDCAGSLAAEPGMKQQTFVAYQCQGSNVGPMGTLRGGNGNEAGGVPFTIQERAVSENPDAGPQGKGYQQGIAYTLEARPKVQSVASAMAVRRLTPRECERLQGFSDDFTAVPFRNKPASDGPRYRALGNSMAVPVVAWIGERIAKVLEARKPERPVPA